MPRSPTTNRDIRDSRRADILRAATRLFARRGLTGTRVDEIAEAAGLSHGLVYHYFPSKEAVFEAILAEKREEAWARVDEATATAGPSGGIRKLLELTLCDAEERPEVTLLVTQALISDAIPERVRASIRRGAREGFARAVALLEEGQRRGEVDPDASAVELAAAVFSLLRGVCVTGAHRQRGSRAIPVPAVDTILRLLEPRGERGPVAGARPAASPGAKRAVAGDAKRAAVGDAKRPAGTAKRAPAGATKRPPGAAASRSSRGRSSVGAPRAAGLVPGGRT